MKKIWIITALLALALLTGCGKADELQAQLDELQATLKTTEERLTAAETDARNAKSELTEVQAQLDAAQQKVAELGGLAGITDSYLSYTDIDHEAVVVPANTKVYQLPSEETPVARSMEVTIYAPVLAQGRMESKDVQGEEWVMVSLPVWGQPTASLGWVKLDDVERYSRANRGSIAWPLSVEEGTVSYSNKECEDPGQELSGGQFLLEGILPGSNMAQITAADGWTAFVDVDALVYPEL